MKKIAGATVTEEILEHLVLKELPKHMAEARTSNPELPLCFEDVMKTLGKDLILKHAIDEVNKMGISVISEKV